MWRFNSARPALWISLVGMALVLAVFGGPAHADDQPGAAQAAASLARPNPVREALESPTLIQFTDTPLTEAIAYLEDYHKIDVAIDEKALHDAGIGLDTPLTFSINGSALKSALWLLLRPIELSYVVRDGVLLITTPDEEQNMLQIRVYDVADLVRIDDSQDRDYDSVIQMIRSLVEPNAWDERSGPGSVQPFDGFLVISQTESVHEGINALLGDLRSAQNEREERAKIMAQERAARGMPPESTAAESPLEPQSKVDADGMLVRTYVVSSSGLPEGLADVVRLTVAPETWLETGGQGSVQAIGQLFFGDGAALPGGLVVRQTPKVHRQLHDFLKQLRTVASKPVGPSAQQRGGSGVF